MYGLEQRYPDATNVIGNGINVVTEDFFYTDGEAVSTSVIKPGISPARVSS